MQNPIKITIRTRDIIIALSGLEKASKGRGFSDHMTALRVGRTIRRLREVQDEAEEAQRMLVDAHAKRDADGKVVEVGGRPGSVALEDMREFNKESHALELVEREVEVWPIAATAFATKGKKKAPNTCTECGQLLGLPDAEPFAILVEYGIILFDEENEEEDGA